MTWLVFSKMHKLDTTEIEVRWGVYYEFKIWGPFTNLD